MKILYAVCNLGLGHATRSLPLIKALIESGHELYIVSTGSALALLKKELNDSVKAYIDYPGYPPMERGYGKKTFYFILIGDLSRTAKMIVKERVFTGKIVKKYGIDLTVTDGRYGVFTFSKPSFIITHQLHFASLLFEKLSEKSTEIANGIHFRNFTRVIVPDFANFERSLSGNLSHNVRFIPPTHLRYVGLLSSYEKIDVREDIDYLFVISGFIKEKKESFVSKLFEQAKSLNGKKVFVLGKPGENNVIRDEEHNIVAYSYVSGEKRVELMNRAKLVIARAGYTTIMDLAELEKKALLVPTPGMGEQQYLARYHREKGNFYSVKEEKINLARDVQIAQRYGGIKPIHKTDVSIKNFLRCINGIRK